MVVLRERCRHHSVDVWPPGWVTLILSSHPNIHEPRCVYHRDKVRTGLSRKLIFSNMNTKTHVLDVYYESTKRGLKRRLTYEYRCDERLKTKNEESTLLSERVRRWVRRRQAGQGDWFSSTIYGFVVANPQCCLQYWQLPSSCATCEISLGRGPGCSGTHAWAKCPRHTSLRCSGWITEHSSMFWTWQNMTYSDIIFKNERAPTSLCHLRTN